MKDFDKSILIGVVFDLSVLHKDGSTNLDIVKNILLKNILDKNVLSKIYVSQLDFGIPRDQGESTYYLITYKKSDKFSIDLSFKNAIEIVGEYAEDCDKYVFLITDCFQSSINYQYKKGFLFNNIRGYKTKICVFGIGDFYDKITIKSIAEENDGIFMHLPTANLLEEKISELIG